MKKVVFASLILMSSISGFSQTENGNKRAKYGFNVGINYSNLAPYNNLPSNASISNNIGFRLGILGTYKMTKTLALSPKAEVSFDNSSYSFTLSDSSLRAYEFPPVNLDLIVHLVYKKGGIKLSPYLLIGPNVKIPVSKNDDSASLSPYYGFAFAIDFGIGIEKAFTKFNFSPELRYSLGTSNVNENPLIPGLKFHNISLVLNFIG